MPFRNHVCQGEGHKTYLGPKPFWLGVDGRAVALLCPVLCGYVCEYVAAIGQRPSIGAHSPVEPTLLTQALEPMVSQVKLAAHVCSKRKMSQEVSHGSRRMA